MAFYILVFNVQVTQKLNYQLKGQRRSRKLKPFFFSINKVSPYLLSKVVLKLATWTPFVSVGMK